MVGEAHTPDATQGWVLVQLLGLLLVQCHIFRCYDGSMHASVLGRLFTSVGDDGKLDRQPQPRAGYQGLQAIVAEHGAAPVAFGAAAALRQLRRLQVLAEYQLNIQVWQLPVRPTIRKEGDAI